MVPANCFAKPQIWGKMRVLLGFHMVAKGLENADTAFAAEMLQRSAGGYGGLAAAQLIEQEPGLRAHRDALQAWKEHLAQRALELAAALRLEEERLFTDRVLWSRKTFAARDEDERLIGLALKSFRDVIAEAMPERAGKPAVAYLDAALTALEGPAPAVDASPLDPARPNDRLVLQYLQLALDGRGSEAVRLLVTSVEDGLPVQDAYTEVLLPAQREIGRLWHANEVSVAEEHIVTATTHQAMAVLLHGARSVAENGATLVAACVPGNVHDIGIRALSDLFQLRGWRTIFLGANVPIADIPAVVEFFQADLVLLGSTLSLQVDAAARVIEAIHASTDRNVRTMVGGAAFDEAPGLWRKVGADAYAGDAATALEEADSLVLRPGG
jgi:methanogenic corrinoid protein MtbC1